MSVHSVIKLIGLKEYATLAIVVCMIAAFFIGGYVNKKKAKAILSQMRSVLVNEFAQFGTDAGFHLLRNSASEFQFYCTGRLRISKLKGRILLKPLNDLLGSIYGLFSAPQSERVILELELEKLPVPPFVFAILSQRESKRWVDARDDLHMFGKLKKHPKLPGDSYAVYTDSPEFMQRFLSTNSILNQLLLGSGINVPNPGMVMDDCGEFSCDVSECLLNPYLEALIISDQLASPPKNAQEVRKGCITLTCCIRVPDNFSDFNGLILPALAQTAISLADWLDSPKSAFKEEPGLKAIREKTRAAAQAVYLKELVAEKTTGVSKSSSEGSISEILKQKKQKEKEERLAQLVPEERRKAEERERKKSAKREAKRQMKKGKVVM